MTRFTFTLVAPDAHAVYAAGTLRGVVHRCYRGCWMADGASMTRYTSRAAAAWACVA
jgi:hypothetical protein